VRRLFPVAAGALLVLAAASPAGPARTVLDAFDGIAGWTAAPSPGVKLTLSAAAGQTGGALRMDFDFQGRAGWAAARKAFPRRMPGNWAFTLRLKGDAPPETLEFKLVDPTGENVWWSVRRGFEFPADWKTLRIRKRQVAFAWGPAHGGELSDLGAVEVTVTAGSGGKGTLLVDELTLEELPAETAPLPPPRAWKSDSAKGEAQELVVDLGGRREFGGLALDWDAADFARVYDVDVSDDGRAWTAARSVAATRGGRAWIALPDSEAAFVRLKLRQSARGRGYVLARLEVEPAEFSETPTKLLESVARADPRGRWPRSLVGEQIYWTLVGVDAGSEKGLLSEDGAVETARGAFSLEPFLRVDGKLLGWADAEISQELSGGDLPLPSVTRRHAGGLSLSVTALADGPAQGSTLRARYRVANAGGAPVRATLYLAVRPVQVNPPWQFLNVPGGFAPVRTVAWDGRTAMVNGERRVTTLTPPSAFGAARFEDGEIVTRLSEGALPAATSVSDPEGFASAAFAWDLEIAAAAARDVVIAMPLGAGAAADSPGDAAADFASRLSAAVEVWREKVDRVSFVLPAGASAIAGTARANLGWILVNRDGPAIHPGARAYDRAWIRDGALTSAALLRLGHAGAAREFLLWFAPYEAESGAVPCCVDRRGADPVPENDSHGELLYLAGEYYRFTRDRAAIEQVWPYLARDAAYIETLRQSRRTQEYRSGPKEIFFGLVPESISHEGYSDRPVHSYWDDFWAVRGLSDAAGLARALGREDEARGFTASRDEMRRDLHASIRRVIATRGIDYIPGSAELGDLDPTSTTIALEPCGEGSRLPARELANTFDRYWERFTARQADRAKGGEYTPYEWRVAGSFVRLGARDRAQALFNFFFADRRPAAWSHWAEVVWPEVRTPKFIGDMPHGWVGSDFIRSYLDLFAYDRDEDGALVLGAGLPAAWLADPKGVSVGKLRTRYGSLDLAFASERGRLRARIGGGASVPPGGFVVPWPFDGRPSSATVNGRAAALSPRGELVVRETPAEIVIAR
jgi:hypothetical protein